MKQTYTTVTYQYLKQLKAANMPIEIEYGKQMGEVSRQYKTYGRVDAGNMCRIETLFCEHAVETGRAIHYYLPDMEFCNWLISCTPTLANEYGELWHQKLDNNVAVLHFPTSTKLNTVLFRFEQSLKSNEWYLRLLVQMHGIGVPYRLLQTPFNNRQTKTYQLEKLHGADGFSVDTLTNNVRETIISEDTWYVKLLAGLGLYMSCFPDAIIDGIPSWLKHPAHHQHKVIKTITIADKIKLDAGGTHDSPTAHFRVGHFRLLVSPRFVNKRFQTVFVCGTFVKGKCKFVLTPEEADAEACESSSSAPVN